MEKRRTLTDKHRFLTWMGLLLLVVLCAGCWKPFQRLSGGEAPTSAALMSWPTATSTPPPPATPTPTQVIWNTFAPPRSVSVTAVPDEAPRVQLPEDTQVWLLLGSDQESPLIGRTQAFHVLLINERLAKASVISIPGNLMVYIPGYTMQRLNAAYALGGMNLVRETLAYNFGLRPDRFVVAHPNEFTWLVDDLGGVDVSVLYPIRDACGGLPAGLHSMNGSKALCYVSFITDQDEVNRVRRQQQVLQLLFTKLVQNGRLVKLPMMYVSYIDRLETDISLLDLLQRVPLALRLGDPQRISYFVLGWEAVTAWELPDNTQTTVLLPVQREVSALLAEAVAAISEPSPLGQIVLTYEAQLTQAVAATQTAQPGAGYVTPYPTYPPAMTSMPMLTPMVTATYIPTAILPTAIVTQEPYPIETTIPTEETPFNPYP